MSVDTSKRFDPTALLTIKPELDNAAALFEEAINALEDEDAENYDFDDVLLHMYQVSKVLQLIKMPLISRFAELLAELLLNVIPQRLSVGEEQINAMSEGVIMLKRYTDFMCLQEVQVPQFLLTSVNKIELALGKKLTREGEFLEPDQQLLQTDFGAGSGFAIPKSAHVLTTYKLCLSSILAQNETEKDFKLIVLCSQVLAYHASHTPTEQYWRLVHIAFESLPDVYLTEPRMRILSRICNYIERFLDNPDQFTVTPLDLADILTLCLSQDSSKANSIRKHLRPNTQLLTDMQLQMLSRHLYGADQTTIQKVAQLLTEEINNVRDMIEGKQKNISADFHEALLAPMQKIANVLQVIELQDSSVMMNQLVKRIRQGLNLQNEAEVQSLAQGLLSVGNAVNVYERTHSPGRLQIRLNNSQIALSQLDEAYQVLAREAHQAVLTAIDRLSEYEKDNTDEELLEEVVQPLLDSSGALLFLNATHGHQSLKAAADFIQKQLDEKTDINHEQLKLLANAVVSSEYFLEQFIQGQPIYIKTFVVGLESAAKLQAA